MSDHGDEPCEERLADDQEADGDLGKRSRTLSRKGLKYAAEQKRRQTIALHERLRRVIRSVEGADCITDSVLNDLATTAEGFKAVLQELLNLYEQDKYNDIEYKAPLIGEKLELNNAYVLIDEIKISKSKKQLETRSRNSRHSHHSRSLSSASTTSSAARIRTLAEAAAARESAEYEKLIAEKEHTRKEREAELKRNHKQERAQHDKDLAMLAATRKVAVAEAKVRAIELAMEEQEIGERGEIPGIPRAKTEERTLDWVQSNPNSVTQSLPEKLESKQQPEIPKVPEVKDKGGKLSWAHIKSKPEAPSSEKRISRQNSPRRKLPEIPRVNTAYHAQSALHCLNPYERTRDAC